MKQSSWRQEPFNSALSAGERAQIHGKTEVGKPAVIRVVVGRGETIQMSRPLPVLKGLDATVIDGGGAILAATGDQAGGGASVVASSDFTLRDLSFENFGIAVAVTPQGVRDLHDIRLTRLRIVRNSIGISIVGRDANGSVGTLRDIAISDSEFSGVPGPTGTALNGIRIEGMTQDGSEAHDPVVDGVLVTRNRFGTGLLEGVDIAGFTGIGATSSPPPSANGGPLRNITISSNSFEGCLDVCVLGIAALAIGGNLSDVAITGLRVVDNDMTNGSGVFLVGGDALGAGATRNNAIRQIEIRGNRMRRSDGTRACLGLALVADLTSVTASGPERASAQGDYRQGSEEEVPASPRDPTGQKRRRIVVLRQQGKSKTGP